MLRPRPILDRIVVRRDDPETQRASGLVLPHIGQHPQRTGEVLAVGPGIVDHKGRLIPTTLKPGDKVAFGSYAGTEITISGEKYQIMREGDVAGVLVTTEDRVEVEVRTE